MQFNISIILAVVACATAGKASYTLSPDLADGFYSIPVGTIGVVANLEPRYVPPGTGNTKRSDSQSFDPAVYSRQLLDGPTAICANYPIVVGDYQAAWKKLADWCDSGNQASPDRDVGFKVGTVYAFLCNWGDENPCSSAEMQEAERELDNQCEEGRAGKVEIQNWKKAYARGNVGANICR